MAKSPIFVGSATAIITPYLENGIDYDKLAELIEFQYAGGTAALIVCGTTGENATQSQAEHDKLIDFCCEKNAGRMKIVAGIGSNNTEHALENALQAKAAGADGLLMITPYYNKTTQKGLIEHFFYGADRVDVPMIVYNVPSRTGIGIKPDTYLALSKHPNINGIKEASANLGEYGLVRAMCGNDLIFWSGNDSDTVAMMALGAKGVISVASNIIPAEITSSAGSVLKAITEPPRSTISSSQTFAIRFLSRPTPFPSRPQ
jgi:4-hydroxy-tetrahydrodipicolinate synthase